MYRAIDKIQNNSGVTMGYVLEGDNRSQLQISSGDLKTEMTHKRINVYNLDITTDGKLIHIPRYDKLGLTVPPEVFFSGKLRDWELKPNPDGSTFLARNLSTGNIFTFRYALSDNGLSYMIAPLTQAASSVKCENIPRNKRDTIDQFKLDAALTKLAKEIPNETQEKPKYTSSLGVMTVDCGLDEELDLSTVSRNVYCAVGEVRPQPYTFIEFSPDTGLARVHIPEIQYSNINILPDELRQLIRSRLIEIHGLALTQLNEFVANKNVKTGPINRERLNRLKQIVQENERMKEAERVAERNRAREERLKAEQKRSKRKGFLGGVLNMMDSFSGPSSAPSSSQSQMSGSMGREPIDRSKPVSQQIQDDFRFNNPNLGVRGFNRAMRDIYGLGGDKK